MERIAMTDKEVRNTIIMMCVQMFISRKIIDASLRDIVFTELINSELNNIYKIKLLPMLDAKQTEDGKPIYKHYVIKLFREKLTAISKSSGMVDFLSEHKSYHKFLILKGASQKVVNQITEYENAELLYEKEMLTNPLEYESQPVYEPFDMDDKEELDKFFQEYFCNRAQLEKMDDDNAVGRFLGLKQGQIVRIIRPSEIAGNAIAYRIVIKHVQIKK